MRKYLTMGTIFIFIFFSVNIVAEDMNATKVLENMITSYNEQMEGIRDIKKITNQGVTYQKWTTENGEKIYKLRRENNRMGRKFVTIYDGDYQWNKDPVTGQWNKNKRNLNPIQFYKDLQDESENIKYLGSSQLDDHEVHIIEVEDVNTLKNSTYWPTHMEGWDITGGNAKIWIGAEDWVLRKIKMDIKGMDKNNQERNTTMTMQIKKYNNIKGALIPFHTISKAGMSSGSLSAEEKQKRERMQKKVEELKDQMENMPPQQKKMLKKRLEKMQQFSGGSIETEIKVEEAKVNTGLSEDLFEVNSSEK